jgi:hypothetical protein
MGKPVFFYGCSRSRSPRRPRSQPLYLPAICWSGAMPSRDASLILASVQRFSLPRLPTTISWASRKASHRFLTLMLSQPSSSSIPAVSTSSSHPSSNQEWTRLAAVVDRLRDSFMSAELGELGCITGSAQLADSLTRRNPTGWRLFS